MALVAGVAVAIALAVAGGRWWLEGQRTVSTNDAYVKSDIVAVSAKVAGRLAEVAVSTGVKVAAGAPAARLDDADATLALKRAEADLATARSGLGGAEVGVTLQAEQTAAQRAQAEAAVLGARRDLDAARVARDRAATDLARNQRVFDAGGVSRQQLDAVRAGLATSEAQVQAAAARVQSAEAGAALAASGRTQVKLREQAVATSRAQIAQAEVAVATARQALANTRVAAPVAGTVARTLVNPGEMVQPGQPIAQIVAEGSLRVEAFLEETKVRRVRAGQPVAIDVDAFPGRAFPGRVTDVGAAAGSEFALIPQNNAVGNFTKVVQRLPVRIAVEDPEGLLRPGMSTTVRIDVHDAP